MKRKKARRRGQEEKKGKKEEKDEKEEEEEEEVERPRWRAGRLLIKEAGERSRNNERRLGSAASPCNKAPRPHVDKGLQRKYFSPQMTTQE